MAVSEAEMEMKARIHRTLCSGFSGINAMYGCYRPPERVTRDKFHNFLLTLLLWPLHFDVNPPEVCR